MPKQNDTFSVRCKKHPWCRGVYKPQYSKCDTCWLLYVLRYQWAANGEAKLGSFNPYRYLIGHVDLKRASAGLRRARTGGLTMRCHLHPKYRAEGVPTAVCGGCQLMYVLKAGDAHSVRALFTVLDTFSANSERQEDACVALQIF